MKGVPFATRGSRAVWGVLMLCAQAVGLALAPTPVTAGPGVNFAWHACLPEGGAATLTSSCSSDDGEQIAVGSFVLAHAQNLQVGIEWIIDLQVDGESLPAWWQLFNAGACRQDALALRFDFGAYPQVHCLDPWTRSTGARGGVAAYFTSTTTPPNPWPDPRRARILGGVASDTPAALEGGREYLAFELVIHSKGTSTCAGCEAGASIVLAEISSVQQEGSRERLQEPVVDYCLRFQGGSVPCSVLPARTVTWGRIKSLYR
jgi:hypothetical protein